MAETTAQRRIPLLDLSRTHDPLRGELLAAITRVVDSQKFIMGEEVKLLEQEMAAYHGVSHAVACASGSDALFLALLAAGVRHGDTVITTPFSFFATAGAISRAGATPVFADIDPLTYNLDPEAFERALAHHPRAKAVIPVHLFGGAADMDPILETAARRGVAVIEDGAQSIGTEYKGRRTQSIGDIGCLSFFPSKNLGCFGDGGLVTTNNPDLAKRLSALRLHGATRKYFNEWIGINSRLDTIQAAVLLVKLRRLDSWTAARQANAARYREALGGGVKGIRLPEAAPYQTRHVYNQFVIRCARRDELKAFLQENGVATEIYYPQPLHLQACYAHLGYRAGDLPVSEQAAAEVLALPVYPGLEPADIDYVAGLLRQFSA
jgi:dTDP-4-amino-4,6-dideoxygalactose transaminase